MEDRDKRRMGEELEPGGRPKAPGRLELLQRFINSHNHDFPPDWDRLGTSGKAQAWLRAKGLIGARERVSEADAAALRELREALRALLAGRPASIPSAALRVVVDAEGRTALVPDAGGATGAAAALLGILHEAQLTGAWARMKACRKCEYAFFDRSKNRSAAWCAMSICGNRTKNRSYYRRRRAG
jgi:predicted RNA-binding Zn ribbon-like protein